MVEESYTVLAVPEQTRRGDEYLDSLENHDAISIESISNPADALDQLSSESVDGIVCGVDFESTDGLAFVESVREIDASVPIVVYTAVGSEHLASQLLGRGATDYVPMDAEEVVLSERLLDTLTRRGNRSEITPSDERRLLALEGAKLGVWDWNMKTDEVSRDSLLTDMLGYTKAQWGDELAGWERLVHPDGKRRHDEALSEHIESKTPYYDCDYRLQASSGEWKWVRTVGRVVEWEDGQPARAVGIHQNIDREKRAQLALQEERDLFREGPAIVFKWRDEPGWPIEYVSRNVEDILGYSKAELEGGEKRYSEFVHEADLETLEAEVAEQTEAGEKQLTPSPYRVVTATGESRWVMEYTRRIGEAGEADRLRGYLVDITGRKEREQKYRNLFEGARDAIMVFDREGYIDYNERTLELFGYDSGAEFLETNPWERSPPTQPDGRDSREKTLEHIERAFEQGEAFFEWIHQRKDGTTFPAEVKLSRFEYEGEAVLHALTRDISERKQQQKQLKNERNRIRAITNAIPDVTIVYDRTGQYREVLTGQKDLLVDDPDELLGANIESVMDPETAKTILDGIQAALETGTIQTVEYSIELDGELTWFEGRITPKPDDEQDEVILLARDITGRKKRERELAEREAKYRSLFEDTRDALMLLDRNGFIDCNERTLELFGVDSIDAFVDLSPWEVSPATQPDGRNSKEAALRHIEGAFEDGEAFFEWTHQRWDGTEFPCEVKLSKFTVDDEPALHALVRDITDRKANEEALKTARAELKAQRDNLEVLNTVVRHDIRNELQLVIAYAETVRTEFELEDEAYLERILETAHDAVDITETARDVTEVMLQADAGLKAVSLQTMLDGKMADARTNHEQVIIERNGPIPDVEVLADDMLVSVFRNLLTNAIVHNDSALPEVRVSVARTDRTVTVRFADNGPGIPDDQKEQIFNKGEKGLESDGTGLGLYLVSTLVDRYGGELWVEDATGGGAAFIVELKRAD